MLIKKKKKLINKKKMYTKRMKKCQSRRVDRGGRRFCVFHLNT